MTQGNEGTTRGPLDGQRAVVEREALLFETGDYPDKNLSVTEETLTAMESAFAAPAPIRVEHTESPVRFGWLTKVWKSGRALMGKLSFTQAAWELVRESGARCLSIGLNRDTLAIEEVSLVRSPRVATARIFSNEALAIFTADLTEAFSADSVGVEVAKLRSELALRDAKEDVRRFLERGKLAPAAQDAALALLAARSERVNFGSEPTCVAEVFRQFMEAQPPVVLFGELAPGSAAKAGRFGQEDRRVFALMGISEDDIARFEKEGD